MLIICLAFAGQEEQNHRMDGLQEQLEEQRAEQRQQQEKQQKESREVAKGVDRALHDEGYSYRQANLYLPWWGKSKHTRFLESSAVFIDADASCCIFTNNYLILISVGALQTRSR